jgi:hypothetical protein
LLARSRSPGLHLRAAARCDKAVTALAAAVTSRSSVFVAPLAPDISESR